MQLKSDRREIQGYLFQCHSFPSVSCLVLVMEAASTFETSVNIYEITRQIIPEGRYVQVHGRL